MTHPCAPKNVKVNLAAFQKLWANPKVTIQRIADAMGITRQAVGQRAKALGLPSRGHLRQIKHEPALLAEMWAAGVSTEEIAAHFGMAHRACASKAARNANLPKRARGASGKRNGGWVAGMTLAEFLEAKAAEKFKAAILAEQRQLQAAQRAVDQVERAA